MNDEIEVKISLDEASQLADKLVSELVDPETLCTITVHTSIEPEVRYVRSVSYMGNFIEAFAGMRDDS